MQTTLKIAAALCGALALGGGFDDDDNNRKGGMNGGGDEGPVGFGALVSQVFGQGPNDEPITVNDLDIVDDDPGFDDQLN